MKNFHTDISSFVLYLLMAIQLVGLCLALHNQTKALDADIVKLEKMINDNQEQVNACKEVFKRLENNK